MDVCIVCVYPVFVLFCVYDQETEKAAKVQQRAVKVKLSLYSPWRPLALGDVEAPTFSDIRLIDGGKFVSPTRWPLFTPRKIPGTHFC
jgi:hypothetical protein